MQIHRWQGLNSWPSLSSSKGNNLLLLARCNIWAQHLFLWKTWGWLTCCSLTKSYITHYAFKPRIIVLKHPLRDLREILFIPIKGNRILLFAKSFYRATAHRTHLHYLYLSIHEICPDSRVGSALWSFQDRVDGHFDYNDLELIKSTENALGIALAVWFDDHWKLFDISTTDTHTLNNLPLILSGRLDSDLNLNLHREPYGRSFSLSEIPCSCVELALMCSTSHTIPRQAYSPKHIFRGKQWTDWHSLFRVWWHKQ